MLKNLLSAALVLLALAAQAQTESYENWIRENYSKAEYDIPVRDGIKLHTIIYTPKDAGAGK